MGGYSGLAGVLAALQGGVNQHQFDRIGAGYNGANGKVGGMHGAMAGLSPYAMHYLQTSGLLQKKDPELQSLTGADGQALTGDALWQAQMMNQNAKNAPAQYGLHSGVDADFLAKLLAGIGHPAFRNGYDASGALQPGDQGFVPPNTPGGGNGGGGPPDLNGRRPGLGYHGKIPKRYQ